MKGSLRVWIERFIFAVAVIAVFKTFDNFDGILKWFSMIAGVLSPFIYGGVIAFLLYLPSKKVEKLLLKIKKPFVQKRARSISAVITLLVLIIILALLLILFLPQLYNNVMAFATSIPSYLNELYEFIQNHFGNSVQVDQIIREIEKNLTPQTILDFLSMNDWGSYLNRIQGVFSGFVNLCLGMVLAIYLLIDRANIKKGANRIFVLILKQRRAKRLMNVLGRIATILNGFIYGQVLDALFVGVVSGIGFQILGIQNAPILGLIYGLFSLIPYFGAFIGVIVVCIFSFLSGGVTQLIIAFIFITVLQQIDGNIVNPKIIGNSIGIKPLYVIFGVTLFGGLFGITGMLLGPPLMAIILELMEEFISDKEYEAKQKEKLEMGDGDLYDLDSEAEPYMNILHDDQDEL